MTRKRYGWLDLLRGIAALAVLIYHFQGFYPIGPAFHASYLAVDLFFCLSGFVLSYAFGPELRRGQSIGAFLFARFVRLWPLHLAGTGLGAAYYLFKIAAHLRNAPAFSDWLPTFALNAFWLPGPGRGVLGGMYPFQPTTWSLTCEMIVSGLFGLLLWRLGPRGRWAIGGAMLAWVAVLGARWGTIDFGSQWTSFLPGLVRSVAEFTLGAAVEASVTPGGRRSARPFLILFLIVVAGLAFMPATAPWQIALCGVPVTLALLATVPAAEPTGRTAWWCQVSGRLSYPIYLFHTPMFLWLCALAKLRHIEVEQLGYGFGALLLTSTVAASLLALRYVDAPLRDWLKSRANRWPSRTTSERAREFT